jgi:predicted PurR-regulated permease PerM
MAGPARGPMVTMDAPASVRPRQPQRSRARQAWSQAVWIIAICALIVVLRLGREALIPLGFALLLAFIFSGLVEQLRRWRVPRALSAGILLVLAIVAIGGTVDRIAAPAQQWLLRAPRVLQTIEQKMRPAQSLVKRLDYISRRAAALASPGTDTETPPPSNVTVVPLSPLEIFAATGSIAMSTITAAAFAFLLLAAGPSALARLSCLLGRDLHAFHALRIIDGIRHEVGRYYGTLFVLNLVFGTLIGIVMSLLDMPNPVLWGVVAGVLHFIPYLGPAITATILTLVALVTFNSNAHVLLVTALYLGLATIQGQFVEPVFLGRRLNLDPILVLLALWIGGWLWGAAGVVLALPVLLAIKVAARTSSKP